MTAITNARTTVAAIGLGAALLAGCSQSQSQVTWQNNGTPYVQHQHQDWWNYQFVYYPASQVYFEPHAQTYYWFQNGLWRQGSELPSHVTLQFENPVVVKLQSERPYMQHHSVSSAFAASHQPIEGSNLAANPQSFAAYIDRYETALGSDQQWATGNEWYPYAAHFQPFGAAVWYNPATGQFQSNAEYTNGSVGSSGESSTSYLHQSTAEAVSDQPDF